MGQRDTDDRVYTRGAVPIGSILANRKVTLKPRYTTVIHQVRTKLGLAFTEYAVIDSINKLSNSPEHPWCTRSKDDLADFISVSRRTVFNAIDVGLEKELIEKNDRGDLRATSRWIEEVELYRSED